MALPVQACCWPVRQVLQCWQQARLQLQAWQLELLVWPVQAWRLLVLRLA
ncbi:hypothetical protein HX875_15205 [Pseudomonas yamanorum]|nr:hypothetical protein [Pseudomonas yamanorum]